MTVSQQQPSEFTEKTKEFEKFLAQKNVIISPKVEIADLRQYGQGRGLVATSDIDEGETLFSIPPTALLRADTDQELAKLVKEYELGTWPALIVRMLAAQHSDEWKPYFDVLPTEFNTPMFWSAEETKNLLKGSILPEKIGKEEADELYDVLSAGILKEAYFHNVDGSREAFHRMGSLIMSYAFDIVTDDGKDDNEDEEDESEEEVKAMVPLADILNSHTQLQNARLTIPETSDGNFEMISSKPIKANEQIYNIYGNQPSSDMLRRYGFVEAGGTSFEVVEVKLQQICDAATDSFGAAVVKKRLDVLNNWLDEAPDTFEIGLVVDEDVVDAVPTVDFEPELMITANALTIDDLKKRQFKELVAMVNTDELYPAARELLQTAIKARREEYGAPPVQPECPESKVFLSKEDMCAQVRLSELRVLDMALDWLDDKPKQEPPTKKKRV